jgi:hypothetical protein
MTRVGATYQTILNRWMLRSCQLCDVAHDFRYDPRSSWFFISCVTSYSVSVAKMRCRRCRTSTHSVLMNNMGSTTDETRRRRNMLITFWLHEKKHRSCDVSSASKIEEHFRLQAEAALLLRRFEDTSDSYFPKSCRLSFMIKTPPTKDTESWSHLSGALSI